MIKKRGLYIAGGGALVIVISFAVAMSIVQDHNLTQQGFLLSEMLEGMFDQVSDRTQIWPGQTTSFSFDATSDTNMIFWGIQIIDYKNSDKALVTISNIYGERFGQFTVDQPAVFETLSIEKSDVYNFNIENIGNRPISVVMMFTKNPSESEAFSDPNSPLSRTLLPLAVSGTLFILGIIAVIVGTVVFVFDYKKRPARSI